MTDEPDERNPWDAPAEAPAPGQPAPDQPATPPPGSWQSDQTGYGQQVPGPTPYGQQQPQYGQQQPQYGQQQPQYGQQPPYGSQPTYPPPYGQQQAPYGYPGAAGPYGAAPYYGPTTSGRATTVLVLGIASLVLLLSCIGFIPAIIALVLAPGAKREIAESGGRLTGESQVKAGKIMSWVSLGITALVALAFAVVVVVAVSTGSGSTDPPESDVRTNATSLAPVGF